MSKEATIIQSFNDVKRQYEYSVKCYDVTESVKILLKRHKEEYDKEKKIFAGIDGYLEAQKKYQSQIADLETKLAESEGAYRDINRAFTEQRELWKQQLAEKEKEIESYKHFKITIGTMENNQVDISSTTYTDQDKISFALEQIQELKKFTEKEIKECNKLLQEELEDDYYIQSVGARQSMCYEFRGELDNRINKLKREMEDE